jgi:carboxyl-terminal processing protease
MEDVIGLRLDEVVKLIRGKKGSTVRLELIPVSAKTDDEHTIIEIVRDTIKLEEQSAQKKVLDIYHDDKLSKIGIIDIPAFYIDFDAMRKGDPQYKSTTRDVSKLLAELIEEGVDGIIIDLRENGGGSLQEANQLTGLFIEQGPTVQIRHSNKQVYRDGKRNSSGYYQGPLVVLINRLSASASEIFAGAIQDYDRGIVVGTQSFGKGTVQSLTPLKQGQLKITESKFYRISGESTQHRGVIPDIEFPAIYDKEKVGESSLDNALAWDRIDPIRHRQYFNLSSIMPELQSKHSERLKTDPDFIYLEAQLELLEESRSITSISLNEKTRLAEQEEDKANALVIENQRRTAKGLEPLASLDEEDAKEDAEATDAEAKESKEEEEDKDEEIDPLLTEAGHILLDALPVYGVKKVATNP